jgi:hypothetical protein
MQSKQFLTFLVAIKYGTFVYSQRADNTTFVVLVHRAFVGAGRCRALWYSQEGIVAITPNRLAPRNREAYFDLVIVITAR